MKWKIYNKNYIWRESSFIVTLPTFIFIMIMVIIILNNSRAPSVSELQRKHCQKEMFLFI